MPHAEGAKDAKACLNSNFADIHADLISFSRSLREDDFNRVSPFNF